MVNPLIQLCGQRRINDEDLMTCEIANNSWGISPRNVRYISRNLRPIDAETGSSNELNFPSTVLHIDVNIWWVFNNLFCLIFFKRRQLNLSISEAVGSEINYAAMKCSAEEECNAVL